jgi:hypothetical protein
MNLIKLFKQRACQLIFCIGCLSLSGLSFQTPLLADYHRYDALELGLALEIEFWTLVQNHEVKKFSRKLAPIFQGLNIERIFSKEEQIEALARSILINFDIRNPKATRSGNVLVFSYNFIAAGTGVTSGPTLSVWKKDDKIWKMVSHSFVPFIE